MAQENFYRDKDKNLYDMNQPYKINEKYTKPIGGITLTIAFYNSTYFRTDGMRDIIIDPYTKHGDYINSHLAVVLSIKFNGHGEGLDLVETTFVNIKVESNNNYSVMCVSGGSTVDSNSDYNMNFRPQGDYGSFSWRTSTNVFNTTLDSAGVVFLIFPKAWL